MKKLALVMVLAALLAFATAGSAAAGSGEGGYEGKGTSHDAKECPFKL